MPEPLNRPLRFSPRRFALLLAICAISHLCAGCMAPVKAVGGLLSSTAQTSMKAAKAGGILLKDIVTVPVDAAKGAWKQASVGSAPEPQPPSPEP